MTAAAQPSEPDGEERFWSLAQPLLTLPGVASSTMMGLPCLRVRGHFFASADPRTGHLLVKLSEARVTQLLDAGQAEPFSPAGRRFRQWAAIPPAMASTWRPLIGEALAFAEQLPGKPGQVATPCRKNTDRPAPDSRGGFQGRTGATNGHPDERGG